MNEFKASDRYIILNAPVPQTAPETLFDPLFWQQQQRVLGTAQGRGTTWFVASRDWFGVDCALRHYYRGGLIGKLNRDKYRFHGWENARSVAEFHLLNHLRQAGLPVPKTIGAHVRRLPWGWYQADILTEKIENAQDLTAVLQHSDLPAGAWEKIGGLIRRLHDLQICHRDLNAHNILVQQQAGQPRYWLIDFDKCGQKSGSFWKAENLERLHRSFQKEVARLGIRFSPQQWQQLQAGYTQGG